MKSESSTISEFIEKYENSNPIAKRLIEGFFRQVCSLVPKDAKTILEAGCGAGYSTSRLSRLSPKRKLEASDVSPELTALARHKNPNVPITEESIYHLKRADNSFDLIVALEVLEHLERPADALVELYRVSSKYLIVSVPREPLWRILNFARGKYMGHLGNTPGHINHWSVKRFKKFIGTQFRVRAVKTPLPWIVLLAEKKHKR